MAKISLSFKEYEKLITLKCQVETLLERIEDDRYNETLIDIAKTKVKQTIKDIDSITDES